MPFQGWHYSLILSIYRQDTSNLFSARCTTTTATNKALVFKAFAEGAPVPGKHLQVEDVKYGSGVAAPENGVVLQSLFASFDPFEYA